jgi:hypothetical protein
LARAIAGAIIAVCLIIGLISAEPPAEQVPVSVGTAALVATAEAPDATPVRLVVGKPQPGAADKAIPISISLVNAAADDVVILSGLPSGSTLPKGRLSATGGWELSADELADCAIRPAQDFVGGADVTVEARRADQSIIDRQELHLEWAGPAPRATADVAPPLAARVSIGQIPDPNEALFREFLQSRGHAAPAHPTRTAARGLHLRSQAAASTGPQPTGSNLAILPLAGGAVRPPHPLAPRGDLSDHQKKPPGSLPAPRQDRPTAVSAAP